MLNRNTVIIFCLAILVGCTPKSVKYKQVENMQTTTVALELGVKPLQFSMSERDWIKISITATNQGSEVVDPELHRTRLYINGKDSLIWNEAIGNGKREPKWFALPPGETVSLSWSTMGKSLFPAPGKYKLVLNYTDKEWSPKVVVVTPD